MVWREIRMMAESEREAKVALKKAVGLALLVTSFSRRQPLLGTSFLGQR